MPIEFPTDQFHQILESAKETAQLAAQYTAEALESQLATDTPKGKSNELSGGWEVQGGGLEYHFVNPVEYALAVHDGSRPHQIKAKYKSALFWDGANNPVKSVWHPGYRGYPWTINSVQFVELGLDDFVAKALQETGAMG